MRAERPCDRDAEEADRAGAGTTTLSPATSPPSSVSPYIAVPAVTTSVASSSDIVSGIATNVLMLLT